MSQLKEFRADGSDIMQVFLNGENVAMKATAFYGSTELDVECMGWVELILLDEKGIVVTHHGKIETYRVRGLVRWLPMNEPQNTSDTPKKG